MTRIETAMVLAAGLGTRMRPLTDTVPKPLLKVAGRALLDRVLDRVAEAGIGTAIVNVHHHADLMEAHLAARQGPPRIVVSDERDALLETGGGVVRALPRIGDRPFLSINSDTIWIEGLKPNIPRLAETFDPARMDALLLVAASALSIGYDGLGDFTMDTDGRLTRRGERMVSPFVYAGAAVLAPKLFEGLAEERFSLNRVFDAAAAAGRLCGIRLEGIWMHVGTPDAIALAEEAIRRSSD
ncbi:nucleotidyltransferase family protein [Xanthobacter tagetidis]|uniref:Nucleotidyltransferase family protein n=1 Tax=Xanthobacter tagetidis TaxID=60216 RepID=A0A3L7APY0_9HYPH|nr:MurNAc alpha-1-phosphate uridylyltransferase [Xanthobacter tagetidis]RLP81691.1 nucleotidyltransferase family protein [Xanthobacter tagetidis]